MNEPTISILGGFRLREGAGGQDVLLTEKEAAFLVYLIVNAKPYAREKLAELFWPDRAQDQSLANLRVLITRLRKKIGDRLRVSGRQVGRLAAGPSQNNTSPTTRGRRAGGPQFPLADPASHLQFRMKTRSHLGARTPARMPESQYFNGFRSGPHSVIQVITNAAEIHTPDSR